jgi:hypothetical protein
MLCVTVRVRSVVWFVTGAVVAALMAVMLMNTLRADAATDGESTFVPVTPCRLLDTRQPGFTAFGAGETRALDVHGTHGACTLPSDAVGVSMNVTALDATVVGTYLTIWPDQVAQPNASSLNPSPGQPPIPNAVTTPLSAGGRFKVFNFSGTVQVIIDVNGYYTTTTMTALQDRVAQLETKLANVTATTVDGHPTVRFTGVNLQIVDGTGDTQCSTVESEACNGLGNLIIGYNEDTDWDGTEARTGSHSLVLGTDSDWTSHSGIVAGSFNTVSGEYATVTGGFDNTASGESASVSGGWSNTASGLYSSVSGGYDNTASGWHSSVSGGFANTASGDGASVSGGSENRATDWNASVSGGWSNTASGLYSSVSGGWSNEASGFRSSVSGGRNNTADGDQSSILGGDTNTATNTEAAVTGGYGNTASGNNAVVSGGANRQATGDNDWRAGGLSQDN